MKKNNYSDLEKKIIHKKYHKSRMIVLTLLIVIGSFMTVAYSANLSSILYAFGTVNLDVDEGNLEIISVTNSSSVNATNNGYNISVKDDSTLVVDFDIDYYRTGGSSTTSITYDVVIQNNSFKTYVLNNVNSTPTFTTGSSTVSYDMEGANVGTTVLKYGESVTVTLTFSLDSTVRNQHYIVDEVFEFEFSASSSSIALFAALNTSNITFGSLDDIKEVDVTVINNSEYNVTYNFYSENKNFEIVNSDGSSASQFTINSHTTENLTIYLKIAEQHLFVQNNNTIKFDMNTTSPLILTYDVGVISATVPTTGAQTIIGNKTVYDDATINFTQTSSTSGLFKNSTSGEITYFYRGNVNNNYVSFAGYTWRIIRIDKYGTRLILDSVIDQTAAWATTNVVDVSGATTEDEKLELAKNLLSYSNSNVKPVLDNWYNNNLSTYSDIIVTSIFCEDYSYQKLTSSGSYYLTYYFGSYVRNGPDSSGYTPEFICEGDNVVKNYLNIGLITGDEIAFAGALFNTDYTNYYLYNPNITNYWWSLSPSYYDTVLNTVGNLIVNGSNGKFHDWQNGSTIANSNAIRPVITLDTDRLSGGSGIVGDEYTFS